MNRLTFFKRREIIFSVNIETFTAKINFSNIVFRVNELSYPLFETPTKFCLAQLQSKIMEEFQEEEDYGTLFPKNNVRRTEIFQELYFFLKSVGGEMWKYGTDNTC